MDERNTSRGAWVAQSVERLALDFGSGHDLGVCELEPQVGLCGDSAEPAWDSLSLSLKMNLKKDPQNVWKLFSLKDKKKTLKAPETRLKEAREQSAGFSTEKAGGRQPHPCPPSTALGGNTFRN